MAALPMAALAPPARAQPARPSLAAALPPPVVKSSAPPALEQTLRWTDVDPDEAEFSSVLQTYNLAFVTYFARFMLNYDASSRAWYTARLYELPTSLSTEEYRQARLRIFGQFAASVQYGLRRYLGADGADRLFNTLVRIHGAYPERRRHLALAFSFLEAAQPRECIASLLRAGDGTPPLVPGAPFSPGLPDYLSQDPTFLLPPTQVPVWDANLRRYTVRGLGELRSYGDYSQKGYSAQGANGQQLSVFGPRAQFAVQRERKLTARDYGLFALSGAAGCCFTHTVVTPLDVVKTRLQTSPGLYKGLQDGVKSILDTEGWQMLFCGVQPTVAGYAWYGLTVYPGYEFFSRLYDSLAGSAAEELHAPIVILAGASATVLACIGVCPAEAARIRIVAQPDFADGLVGTIKGIAAEDGWGKLYDGFGPILLRQVVFGMVKFYTFDSFTDTLYAAAPFLKAQVSSQLFVSLLAGLAAGVASACISQPADTILSEVNRQSGRSSILSAVRTLWEEGGGTPSRFFTGLASRCVWSGSIISGQFFLYDIARTVLGVASDDLLLFLDVQFKDLQL